MELEVQEFFTWTMLGTYAGATLATAMLTQALKSLIPIKTQALSIAIAFLVLVSATAFTTGITLDNVALCVINSVVVSCASNGAYDVASKNGKKK